jgi:hypothetical protein
VTPCFTCSATPNGASSPWPADPRTGDPTLSAEALGALAGWVAALHRWRLLCEIVGADGPIFGAVMMTTTDLDGARRLAASSPVDAVVLTMRDADG